MTQYSKSNNFFERAKLTIPLCSQTFSKSYMGWSRGAVPMFVDHGQGAYVWDVDGNKYLDYSLGLGPQLLGHAYPAVVQAICERAHQGFSFSLPTPLEIQLAEKLIEHIPSAEMVRFGKNGSDVTSAAVRIARGHTGRDHVACGSYHGWQDWYIGATSMNLGIPQSVCELTHPFKYNAIEELKTLFQKYPGQIACVIMEPVIHDPPEPGYLEQIRQLTLDEGTLLVFDEVVTGLRFGLGGAQQRFGVIPDLTCLGKALGNGMPVSAICGKKEYLQLLEKIFFSFTHGGEALSLAAALATIDELEQKDVSGQIRRLGKMLNDGTRELIQKYNLHDFLCLTGFPERAYLDTRADPKADKLVSKTFLQQEMVRRGILFNGQHMLSFSHTEKDISDTLAIYEDVFKIFADAIAKNNIQAKLAGDTLQPVFRQT